MTLDPLGPMATEIREQPDRLRCVLESAPSRIRDALGPTASWRSVRFVGCGDMAFAAQSAAIDARARGLRAHAHRSMDLRWVARELGPRDLVVAGSISGRTPRTVEAAALARAAGARTVAVTASPDSRLAKACDSVLSLALSSRAEREGHAYPGYRHAIAQTASYTAALLAFLCVADAPGRAGASGEAGTGRAPGSDVLASVPDRLEAALRDLEPAGSRAVRDLGSFDEMVVLGSGPWLPTARYAAAKLLEFAVPARAQCLEEFHHLEVFVAGPGTAALLLAPDAASAGRAREIAEPLAELGVRCALIAAAPGVAGLPFVEVVPGSFRRVLFPATAALQWIAVHAAAAAGRDTGRWLGGVRTQELTAYATRVIRGSRVLERLPDPPGSRDD